MNHPPDAPDPSLPADAALRASEQRYRQLFESNVAGVYRVGLDGRIHDLNPAMARMLGYSREELIGRDAAAVYFDAADRDAWISRLLEEGSLTNSVLELRRKDGSRVWTLENCSLATDPVTGEPAVLGTAIDITEQVALQERLEQMAYHDPLTGLANRRMLQEMTHKAIARASREGGRVAMIYTDLVRFKHVNDTLGHTAGDRVLCEVAARFGSLVRATDTLARVGGDEFALLLVAANTVTNTFRPALELRETLTRPFVVGGRTFHLDARIGVAFYPEHGISFDELLDHSDHAMRNPNLAVGEIGLYRPGELKPTGPDPALERRFREALDNREFELHYQPIFGLPGREIVGFEALGRWRQPDGSLVEADQFISIAEQAGLVGQLNRWALQVALHDSRSWSDSAHAWVALNLTPAAFGDTGFPQFVRETLRAEGVDGSRVALEVTERLAMREPAQARAIMRELRRLGLRIVIDDFGRGSSSIAFLQDFPVDAVKIDRLFIGRIGENARHARLVDGVIALCERVGIDLIAEGIESAGELEWLERHGCGFAQGHHLLRPVPVEDVPLVLADPTGYTRRRQRTDTFLNAT